MTTPLVSLNHLYKYITLYFICLHTCIVCILYILLPMYSTETHTLYNIWLLFPTFTINTYKQQCKANPQLQTSQKERRLLLLFIGLHQFRAAIGLFNSSIGMHDFKSSLFFWTFIFPNVFFYN